MLGVKQLRAEDTKRKLKHAWINRACVWVIYPRFASQSQGSVKRDAAERLGDGSRQEELARVDMLCCCMR